MKKEELINRIIARGEHSNHCHVITGDAIIERNEKGEVIIEVGKEGVIIKHLLETEWLNNNEVWTNEHTDISLSDLPEQIRHGDVLLDKIGERRYKYVQQVEWHPYERKIQEVKD
jgi:hypothetical protein